jgi:hypothetical protein
MKKISMFLVYVVGTGLASAQGFVYDQQSSGTTDGSVLSTQAPLGQSFTPLLDSIGFVDFYLSDGTTASMMQVNIRSGSITGPILGTTSTTTLTPNLADYYGFVFSTPISLTPGTQYFLEPVVVGGGGSRAFVTFQQYSGGDAIFGGSTFTDRDFLFREGIVSNVPEPSTVSFCLLGGAAAYWLRKRRIT